MDDNTGDEGEGCEKIWYLTLSTQLFQKTE